MPQGHAAAGPSRQPRWHKYEIEGLGELWGFTVDRVPELEAVKQEELAATHDPPARPFASPPFIRSSTDVLRAARAGCRMHPRSVRIRSIRLSARRRGSSGRQERKRSDAEVQAAQKEAEAKKAKKAKVRATTRFDAR